MSNRRKIYCTISILLSFCVFAALWHYVEGDYKALSIIVLILITRLNIYIFTPKKTKANL